MKHIIWVLTIFLLSASLSSCGKISDPSPIEGTGYPHSYPRR